MRDKLFKISRKIIPFLKGIFFSFLNKDVKYGSRISISSDIICHPGCGLQIGSNFVCGKNATISIQKKGNLKIGDNVGVGANNQIICHGQISIGNGTILGPNVCIYDHNHMFNFECGVSRSQYDIGKVCIGNNCWLGAGCLVLKDVHIGDNCIVGAGSVVTKDIPDCCVVVGNPAKIIKRKDTKNNDL